MLLREPIGDTVEAARNSLPLRLEDGSFTNGDPSVQTPPGIGGSLLVAVAVDAALALGIGVLLHLTQ